MRKLLFFIFITSTIYVNGQQLKNPFTIFIADNYNTQFLENDYLISNDSLIITAVNDKGVTHVDYLKRRLTNAEKRILNKFLNNFNVDSLNSEYFSDFNNLKFIDHNHYPRLMRLEFTTTVVSKKIKVTNCYVYSVANLINTINPMLPEEVRIKYKKDDFDKTY